jgi:hypothetical protein
MKKMLKTLENDITTLYLIYLSIYLSTSSGSCLEVVLAVGPSAKKKSPWSCTLVFSVFAPE